MPQTYIFCEMCYDTLYKILLRYSYRISYSRICSKNRYDVRGALLLSFFSYHIFHKHNTLRVQSFSYYVRTPSYAKSYILLDLYYYATYYLFCNAIFILIRIVQQNLISTLLTKSNLPN